MEKISKEKLMEMTGLSEEDLDTVAGGDIASCLIAVIKANDNCLADCESARSQPSAYATCTRVCEKQYKLDARKCDPSVL